MTREKVYFAASGGRIKVGTTVKGAEERIAAISSHLAEPLRLIGAIAGGLPMERAVQRRLKPWRIKGEWFRDCEEVREIIQSLRCDGPAAIGYAGPIFADDPRAEQHGSVQPRSRPGALGACAHLMWGKDTVAKLAEFCSVDETTAALWIEDSTEMPRRLKEAFCFIHGKWMLSDETDDKTNLRYFLDYEQQHGRGLLHYRLRNHLGSPGMGAA